MQYFIRHVHKGGFYEFGGTLRSRPPDSITKVSDNEVQVIYQGKYRQTIKADGTGNERHNFTEKIEVIE